MADSILPEQDKHVLESLIWRLRIVAVGIILAVFARLSGIFLEVSLPVVRQVSQHYFGGLLPESLSIFAFWLVVCAAYLWSYFRSSAVPRAERRIAIAFDLITPLLICLYIFFAGSQSVVFSYGAAEICMTAYMIFVLLFLRPLTLFQVVTQRIQARL